MPTNSNIQLIIPTIAHQLGLYCPDFGTRVVEAARANPVTTRPLELKRGIAASDSTLVKWCRVMMEGGFTEPVRTVTLSVFLMDGARAPVRAWTFADVYPVKWEIEPFNASSGTVAIEKIVLNYSYLNRTI